MLIVVSGNSAMAISTPESTDGRGMELQHTWSCDGMESIVSSALSTLGYGRGSLLYAHRTQWRMYVE